jgi:hypothetical protein
MPTKNQVCIPFFVKEKPLVRKIFSPGAEIREKDSHFYQVLVQAGSY